MTTPHRAFGRPLRDSQYCLLDARRSLTNHLYWQTSYSVDRQLGFEHSQPSSMRRGTVALEVLRGCQ